MSEIQPPRPEHMSIASIARDILLHHGRPHTNPNGETFYRERWDGFDAENNMWLLTLSSRGLYWSSAYSVNLRSMTSSDTHRYIYDIPNDELIHEYPVDRVVAKNQEYIAQQMRDWLAQKPTPDAVEYDAEHSEYARQIEFDKIGAYLAVKEALETHEGDTVFRKLVATHDPQVAAGLYKEFYDLTKRSSLSFSVGGFALRAALQPFVESVRQKQLSSEAMDDSEKFDRW